MKTSLLLYIREVKDFPKEGISFKDITPILSNPELSAKVIDSFVECLNDLEIDAIVGVESRGFLFGMLLANALKVFHLFLLEKLESFLQIRFLKNMI